jgi:hypothetical protein
VEELLEHCPEVVVLSRGRRHRPCPETLALLTDDDVEVASEETGAVIDEYNRELEVAR